MLLHGVAANELNMVPLAEAADNRFAGHLGLSPPLCRTKRAYAWFPVRFTEQGPVLEEIEAKRSRVLFLRFIEEYKAEHDLSNVFLLGFSQGAIMAAVCV